MRWCLPFVLLLLTSCVTAPVERPVPPGRIPVNLLPGWAQDDPAPALAAFKISCRSINRRSQSPLGGVQGAGDLPSWKSLCRKADGSGAAEARAFFETNFIAVPSLPAPGSAPLITGYFEPLLYGSRVRGGPFQYALHRRPNDLAQITPAGGSAKVRYGRATRSGFRPYFSRADIEAGAIDGRGAELFWVNDPIAKFFLEIQGSGIVELPSGQRIRVGYAAQNGHRYYPIGRHLIDTGAVAREDMSLQAIRDWLRAASPEAARGLMNRNPSYVFFRELGPIETTPGPLGALNLPLTPIRSVAVDRSHIPLGAPVWLDTTAPYPDATRQFRRLTVAQDVGGAIRGPARADLFWGTGVTAEHVAGHMKQSGRIWFLVPRP